MLQQNQHVSFFLFLLTVICLAAIGIYKKQYKLCIIIFSAFVMGILLVVNASICKDEKLFIENESYKLKGRVDTVYKGTYNNQITLNNVSVYSNEKWNKLKSKIRVSISDTEVITQNDKIVLTGKCLKKNLQMNPSDMDVPLYLRSQKIAACFDAKRVIEKKTCDTIFENCRNEINSRISQLYGEKTRGIIAACLMGDDEDIVPEIKNIYNASGIGHVLCISGFHVGVVTSCITFILSYLPLKYRGRKIVCIIAIIIYAVFTGAGISTLRAVIMSCIVLTGRVLFKEEDGFTDLALAAFIILIFNPYQLFMAGFQLSFCAVLSILFCLREIEKKELFGDFSYPKWQKSLMMWITLQIATWPVLAYHFFEVPFFISLVNLIVIPVYSVVIIGGWISVLIFPLRNVALLISSCIEIILWLIEKSIKYLIKLPFSSICTGRPDIIMYIFYFIMSLAVLAYIYRWEIQIIYKKTAIISGVLYFMIVSLIPGNLKITGLYVGQGDGIVIELPGHEMAVIDGGKKGKGKIISQYIKYCGENKIDAMFLSHSDEDHICGLMEIIESGMKVNNLFISSTDSSSALDEMLKICNLHNVNVVRIKSGDNIRIGKVNFKALAPESGITNESANDNSLVMYMSYNRFKAVFTGDKSCSTNGNIYNNIEKISLLKVSHHGSYTGTDTSMLLKLKPEYAMISCGINNRYGHPDKEVLDFLTAQNSKINRTDIEGAICYETDGTSLMKTSLIK